MSDFKTGTRVNVINWCSNEIKKGVINTVFEDIEIAIVQFDDGNVEKVYFSSLSIDQATEAKAQEEPTEPVEKSGITITPDEFRKIAVDVITKESEKGGPILTIVCILLVSKLHRAIFGDEGNDD